MSADSTGPLSLEDRLLIQELLARYALAVDDCDLDEVVNCFTADAEFERAGLIQTGHDAIRAFFDRSMTTYALTIHTPHTPVLEVLGSGRVGGTIPCHAELLLGSTWYVTALRYRDEFTRSSSGWKIARRAIETVYFVPITDLVDGSVARSRVRLPGNLPSAND